MSKILTLLLLIGISASLFGQELTKNTVSLRFVGLHHKPLYLPGYDWKQDFYVPKHIRLGYQRSISEHQSLRVIGAFRYFKANEGDWGDAYYYEKFNEAQVQFGYQLEHNFKKLEVYGGIDMVLVYSHLLKENGRLDNPETGSVYGAYIKIRTRTRLGLAPFLGINYHINNKWSIGAETNIQGFRNWLGYENIEEGTLFPVNKPVWSIFYNRDFEVEINPVATIAVNYHF